MRKLNIRNQFLPLLMALVSITGMVYGQDASIRGFVYEKETGEPVIFTNVYLQGTTFGAATDVNGYYNIANIPAGTYNLMVTYLGYDTLQMPITIRRGELITRQLYLKKAAYAITGVNISAEREEARTETRTSVHKDYPTAN